MTRDLGCTNSIDVINDLVSLAASTVIDVGCGDLTFTRQLAEHGARAQGVDPDPKQAARNREADAIANVAFVEAGATALPVADGAADGVFFSFSLHHVPAIEYPQVFAEVRRVLKPTGYLCVIEPADCPLNEIMRFFHDETRVRSDAQDALVQLAVPAFESHATFRYHSYVQFDSFDAFATHYGTRTFNPDYTEADVRRPEVEAAFERLGAPEYRFESPKQMMFLRGLRSP
ncbi:MAG: class I SAM-dependent methyltransferase [Planctomycetes bacterium]|nr:class I SAM-dependent methyltransferase [Planctomycetota bacterium]